MTRTRMLAKVVASLWISGAFFSVAAEANDDHLVIKAPPIKAEDGRKVGGYPWHQVKGVYKCDLLVQLHAATDNLRVCDENGAVISDRVEVTGTLVDCNSSTKYPLNAYYADWYCYDGNAPKRAGGKTMYPIYTSVPQVK